MNIFSVTIGLLTLVTPMQCVKTQNMNQKIKTYFTTVYPEKQTIEEGEFQYRDSKILKQSFDRPTDCYSNLEFYTTVLQTGYFEFFEVKVLITVENGNVENVQMLKSLSFEPPNKDFLKVFFGCERKSWKPQHELASELTSLMATVAVQPKIEDISSKENHKVSFRINQANGSYIDFEYHFNENGVLDNISFIGN